MFEAETFAEVDACDVDAISPSFVPNFIPLFQNQSVITQDVTTDGVTILMPMEPVTGLVVRSPAPPINADGDEVELLIVARNPSAAPLTFSATGLPPGLSIDPMLGLITGTLSRDASAGSPYTVNTTVSNGTDLDGVTFVWTVTNPEPILALPFVPVDTLVEGMAVALQAEASDPDGDPLVFSATGLPPALTINASTGLISGTLTQTAAAGSPYTVSVTVSDGLDSSSLDFTLTVTNPVPMIASPGEQSSTEGASVGLQIEASDPDGDPLVFSATGLPPDLTINPSTGFISGTIGAMAANGSPYTVVAEVSDGVNSSQIMFTWVVNAVFPLVSIADQTALESNAAGAVFLVSLSAVTGRTVTVEFATADDSAIAGQDYRAVSGQLTFNPGVTTQMLTVPLIDDTLDEPSETFLVNLRNAVNADIEDGQAVGTIQDDDVAPELSINNVTVTEGNSGTTAAEFTVTLSEASGQTIRVDFSTANGTAVAGEDYQATSGTLVFSPGSTTQMLTVLVVGDVQVEPDETFVVNLSNAANAEIADGQGAVLITNDDVAPQLSIDDVTVAEGNVGPILAVFTVTLAPASSQTVTVNFATADDSAIAGQDYQAASGTLTFTPGVTNQTLTVFVIGDEQIEMNETFLVNLSGAVNAEISDNQGVGTIADDDMVVLIASETTDEIVRYDAGMGAFLDVLVQDDLATLDRDESGGLTSPGHLLLGPDHQLYVASRMTNEILRYDVETGAFLGVLVGDDPATPHIDESGGLTSPDYLLLSSDHQLYVASEVTNEILRYDAETGVFLGVLVGGDLATPNIDVGETGELHGLSSMAFGPDGDLYVSSLHTNRILRYDARSGEFLNILVGDDPKTLNIDESGGLQGPSGIVCCPNGELYVSSLHTHAILRYDGRTGAFLDIFVSASSGGLLAPSQLSFGPDGQLYVSSLHTQQILRYDGRTGIFLSVSVDLATSHGELPNPVHLMFMPQVHEGR
jgi:sugar lactone lactonase YvrE